MTADERVLESVFSPRLRRMTVSVLLQVTTVAFGSMALGAVLPRIARELNGADYYAWSFTVMLIAGLVSTVLSGWLCDRYGARVPLIVGMTAYVAGLISAALAPSMLAFVASRGLQGLGTGAAGIALYVVVGKTYEAELRPRMLALFSASWILPSILGPIAAASLAELAGWRSVFFVLAGIGGVSTGLAAGRADRYTVAPSDSPGGRPLVLAALSVAAGLALFQYGLDARPVWAMAALVGSAILLTLGLRGVLPPGTLRLANGLPAAVAARGLVAGSYYGAVAFLPLLLTTYQHMPDLAAAATLTVASAGWQLGAWWQARPSRARGRLARTGSGILAAGILGVSTTTFQQVTFIPAPVGTLLIGGGMGICSAVLAERVLALAAGREGQASASAQVSETFGKTMSVAVVGQLVTAAVLPGAPFAPGYLMLVLAAVVCFAFVSPRVARSA